MKSFKISLDSGTYPLFIDFNMVSRLGEICDLYRFPQSRFLIISTEDAEKYKQLIKRLKDFKILSFEDKKMNSGFESMGFIYDTLSMKRIEKGITLVVLGEKWLIDFVGFTIKMLNVQIHLVCVPTSFWAMLESGVNDKIYLSWQKRLAFFSENYCPKLVILDANFLESKKTDDYFLGNSIVLRHSMIVKPDLFFLFKSDFTDAETDNTKENTQILERLITARIALYQDKNSRPYMDDFGIRFLNYFQLETKQWPATRDLAMLVFIDICWRWKLSKELNLCSSEEMDPVFSLIENICIKYKIGSQEWNKTKLTLLKLLCPEILTKIYIPEAIGSLKLIDSIDFDLAEKCLNEC